jgi:hypothetical protein
MRREVDYIKEFLRGVLGIQNYLHQRPANPFMAPPAPPTAALILALFAGLPEFVPPMAHSIEPPGAAPVAPFTTA